MESSGTCWGKANFTLRTRLEEAAAHLWDFENRLRPCESISIERKLEKGVGTFSVILKRVEKLESKHGGLHRNREFISKMSMHLVDKDTIFLIIEPESLRLDQSFVIVRGEANVLAKESSAIKFIRVGGKETKVEFVTNAKLGVFCSKRATKNWLEKRLFETAEMQRYFDYAIDLNEMTYKVGETLGYDMAWNAGGLGGKNSKSNRAKHVEEVIIQSKALNAIRRKYPWIVTLMQRAREGALATNNPLSVALDCVGEKEARIIGNNLMPALKTNKTVAGGIDQWRAQNKAIDELFIEFPWMIGLLVTLGQGVIKSAPWGLKWR